MNHLHAISYLDNTQFDNNKFDSNNQIVAHKVHDIIVQRLFNGLVHAVLSYCSESHKYSMTINTSVWEAPISYEMKEIHEVDAKRWLHYNMNKNYC